MALALVNKTLPSLACNLCMLDFISVAIDSEIER
jgi:hypothetical protein